MKSRVTPQSRRELLSQLALLYPNPKSELNFQNDYELIVAVILSAQCTDKKVNEVTPILFKEYPTFKALSTAPLATLEKIVRPVNYYRTKSKNLIGMAERVVTDFGGVLPREYTELTTLPGVGRKTANVILTERGETAAFPVDTHVFRVSHRLGLSRGKTPDAVEEDLKSAFPEESWRHLHHWLIFHGRRVCKAQRPLCSICAFSSVCPTAFKLGEATSKRRSHNRDKKEPS